MILAGLDEAGYGPLLGPLVVGSCAFKIDAQDSEDLPCIWKRLTKVVSKKRSTTGRKLHINDSKIVYSGAAGLKELERSVLSLIAAMHDFPADLPAMFSFTAAHVLADLPAIRGNQSAGEETFPIEQDAISIRMMANALRAEMLRQQTHCVYLSARVVLEGRLNTMMAATRNKASVLFSPAPSTSTISSAPSASKT